MEPLYLGTLALLAALWLRAWLRFRDPFHPAIVLLPMFGFLYGVMPLELYGADPQRFCAMPGGPRRSIAIRP